MSPTPEDYRRNVAIVLVNDEGQILAGERNDVPGAWQLPQGGIDEGETVVEAMYREASEELGISNIELIVELAETIRYEWPETLYHRGFRGQEQHYCLVRLTGEVEFDLNCHEPPEFRSVQWMDVESFLALVNGFKREAYAKALHALQAYFPNSKSAVLPE